MLMVCAFLFVLCSYLQKFLTNKSAPVLWKGAFFIDACQLQQSSAMNSEGTRCK